MRGWFWQTGLVESFFFCLFLTSLASWGVISWLGSIVVDSDCGGVVAIARSLEAPEASGRTGYYVRSCPMCFVDDLRFWSSLILRWGVIEAL